MEGRSSLVVLCALVFLTAAILVVCSPNGVSAASPGGDRDENLMARASTASESPPPGDAAPVESMRRRFEDWSATGRPKPEAPVRMSVERTQPEGPACLLWGRVEPDVAYRWARVEAKQRRRREIAELQDGVDPDGPRTAADVGTRFVKSVEAAKYTFKNAHLLDQLPQDDTPLFSVRKIRLTGNTQISSDDLLYGLPAVYCTVPQTRKEAVDPNRIYDFRVLCEIIGSVGVERDVSQRTIEGFTKYVVARYQDAGLVGIYVYVNADAIDDQGQLTNGVLPVSVIEGRVADISMKWFDFEGQAKEEHHLRSQYIETASPARKGEVIRKKDLDTFTRLLNLNPDRHIAAVVSPSSEPNMVNLTYNVYERDPWHYYVQVDNSGTDERQWNPRIGLLNTNLTGNDDRLSAMLQADVESPDENYAAFGLYELPLLTPRFRLGFYAGVSEFDITPEVTGGLVNFLGDGWFAGTTLRYNIAQVYDWMFDLTGRVSEETSRVERSLGTDSDVDMTLVGFGFDIHRLTDTSQSSLSFERAENYGGDLQDYQDARSGTDPDFVTYTLTAAHEQSIDPNRFHRISGRFRAVTSNERLVPAKMTTFGGLYTVRGYDEDEIVADGGILASLEYRFYLSQYLFGRTPTDQTEAGGGKSGRFRPLDVSLVGFTDYGRPRIEDPILGEFDTQNMWGVGVGAIIEVKTNFVAAIYHSWALRETEDATDGSILTDAGDTQWNFSFLYRW